MDSTADNTRMGKTAERRFKGTTERVDLVRKMYVEGLTRQEISVVLGKSIPQIDRYFSMGGPLTPIEKAQHLTARYTKK